MHQARPIRVIADDFIISECQRIDRLGSSRPFRQPMGNRISCRLERYSDVHAFAAALPKMSYGNAEAIERSKQGLVAHVLTRPAGKLGVEPWRLAVGNRIADDGIVIWHEEAL